MPKARPIFIGGTSSHAGKSWVATAICAWLRRRGISVAPFKAQNMSNNSYPCRIGGEIGRAQVAQAEACGLEPEPSMNPILLKPTSPHGSQVIVNGKPWKTLSARSYYEHFDFLFGQVLGAYEDLASRFDVIVIEGAGSVTELNLRSHDLVNLGLVTKLAAPWILVSDIERGGIFASIIGTFHLLSFEERSLLRSFAVNKFRGDLSLFEEGKKILESKTGCRCLGVFPFADQIDLDAEDSLSLPAQNAQQSSTSSSRCAIIRLPHISNTTDFRLFPWAQWLTSPVTEQFDIIFLPGTKSTIDDLLWLKQRGFDEWIRCQHQKGATLIGICGGLQMLGHSVIDPLGMESSISEMAGLGLLPVKTVLKREKTTRRVNATTPKGHRFGAYEIHLGQTSPLHNDLLPFASFDNGNVEGFRGDRIFGTYLHGAFEDPQLVAEMLGIENLAATSKDVTYDQLADWFAQHSARFDELYLA